MNLLYFTQDGDSPFSGVANKIKQQSIALAVNADIFFLIMANYSLGISVYKYDKALNTLKLEHKIEANKFIIKYLFYSEVVYSYVCDFCLNNNIEAIYCRKTTMMPCFIKMFKKIKKEMHIVIGYELPTFPYIKEFIKQKRILGLLLEIFFSKPMYKLVDCFFIITDSINKKKIKFKNWTRISNGIDANTVSVRISPPDLSEGLHLLGVANVSFWHGYDRVIEGLHQYYENTPHAFPVFFHIVGVGKANNTLETLTTKHNLKHRIIFHGSVYGEELDNLFKKYHIAVGSLGVHRINLSEASTLKAREYCARGVPFIMSMKDPDFGEDFPYIHNVSNDDTPVDILAVIDFARAVLDEKKHTTEEMRSFALSHLDWKTKMEKVYFIISTLINKS